MINEFNETKEATILSSKAKSFLLTNISKLKQFIIETIVDLISKKENYIENINSKVQFYFTFLTKELVKNKIADDI